jgi:O-antigen ligase
MTSYFPEVKSGNLPAVAIPVARDAIRTARLAWLLVIWLGSLLFYYQYLDPFLNLNFGIRISPDRLLFLTVLLFFLTVTAGRRRGGLIERLMLAFAVLCTLSWLIAKSDAEGARLRWLTTIFQLTYFPFTAYYIGRNSRFSEREVRILFKGIAVIQSYLVINGLAEHFQIVWLVWPKYIINPQLADQWERLSGPFCNSAMYGAALVMNFGCLSLMTLYCTGFKRKCVYALLILSCACIYWTTTRTVWVGFAAMFVVFYFSRTGLRPLSRNLAICLAGIALTGVAGKFSPFKSSLFSQRQNTIDYRMINFQVGMKVFCENPIFGVGYGNFAKRLGEFEERHGDSTDDVVLTSGNENTWLGILTELGLLGLALYLSIFFLLIRTNVRSLRDKAKGSPLVGPLAALGLAMVFYLMLNWNTGDLRFHLYEPVIAFLIQGVAADWSKNAA